MTVKLHACETQQVLCAPNLLRGHASGLVLLDKVSALCHEHHHFGVRVSTVRTSHLSCLFLCPFLFLCGLHQDPHLEEHHEDNDSSDGTPST